MVKKIIFIIIANAILISNAVAQEQFLRDPTAPIAKSGVGHNLGTIGDNVKIQLQAILTTNSIKKAIINGNTYRVGDDCEGMIVLQINKTNVVLTSLDGKEKTTIGLFSNKVNN